MAVIFAVMAFFYKPVSKRKEQEDETVALVPKDNDSDSDDEEMATFPDSSDLWIIWILFLFCLSFYNPTYLVLNLLHTEMLGIQLKWVSV